MSISFSTYPQREGEGEREGGGGGRERERERGRGRERERGRWREGEGEGERERERDKWVGLVACIHTNLILGRGMQASGARLVNKPPWVELERTRSPKKKRETL